MTLFDYLYFRQDSCHICKEELSENYICPSCLSKLEFLDGNFEISFGMVNYPLFYNNMIKSIIKEFKFNKKTYLVKPLSLILFEYMKRKEDLMDADLLTYVSMDDRSLFERGYNQAYLICKELSKLSGKELIAITKKKMRTKEQNKSNLLERKRNLSSSHEIIKGLNIQGKKILLIDDLVTTGSTLEAISKIILDEYDVKLRYLTITSSRIGENDD